MFGQDLDPNSAPGVEVDFDPAPFGGEGIDQVVEQQVCEMFVENPLVPIAPEVELEGFGFHDLLIGDVADEDFGEVRLAGLGTQAGELIGTQFDDVSAFGISVGEGFQLSFRLSGSFSKLGQVFVFGIVFCHRRLIFSFSGNGSNYEDQVSFFQSIDGSSPVSPSSNKLRKRERSVSRAPMLSKCGLET